MSNSAPIIPPGSPLQRTGPDRDSRLFVTVLAVVAVHVMLLTGLLIQGCHREDKNAAAGPNGLTNYLEPLQEAGLPPIPPQDQLTFPAPSAPPVSMTITQPEPVVPLPPEPESTVSRPAPGAPPAPRTPLPVVGGNPLAAPRTTGPPTIYTVKRGDNLTRIARAHGTTVKAIRELNNLKTDRILVDQKLKIPSGNPPASPAPATP
jgi:nucleoid-associated protein YgaU